MESKEKIVPVEGREMNFWDLCVACGQAIGRGCKAFGRLVGQMIRLTWCYWWLVLPVLGLGIGGGYYYTRPDNITYKVNAIVYLNGATIQQFEQAYEPLQSMHLIPDDAPIRKYVGETVTHFKTFRIVDSKHDGIADYIDFKQKSSPKDTLEVQMQDRLCLQFRIKSPDTKLIPEIEKALLDYLNSNEAMIRSYEAYLPNLEAEVAFNHAQALKLDSLTSVYYFNTRPTIKMANDGRDGMALMSDHKVKLFLEEIYKQQAHTQQGDYRKQLATAPVVLENHFAVDPNPVNGRRKLVPIFTLMGWILGCAIAQMIAKRKSIFAWLKQ